MSKCSFLLLTTFLWFLALAPQAFGQCMAEAGTITVNDDGGGTNPFVVCFGEAIDVTSDGNFTLPPSGPLLPMAIRRNYSPNHWNRTHQQIAQSQKPAHHQS
jgi:hypothetical protein